MANEVLRVEIARGVAWATIDHPPDHVVDGALLGAVASHFDALEADPDVRVAVFRSADPDFFLMHGDVRGILRMPAPTIPVTVPNPATALLQRIHTSPLLTIAMVDGIARGGGAELLVALDLRYSSTRTVLGQPEVAMGILPGAGGTARLPRLLGRARALEVILTGRDVDAAEARDLGWLDVVVEPDALEPTVTRVAERIASMPAESIAAVKRVVEASLAGLDAALVTESDAFARLVAGGGHRERMERFLAAGGQTRAAERGSIEPLLDAMNAAMG
ncbi:MAG: enoyl-CoA hydratase/isomerase family protein [Acidimicrobiia bacterium]|jgi:enoyl-CoA hydratase/carnithine racemase